MTCPLDQIALLEHSKQEYTIILYHLSGKILFIFLQKLCFHLLRNTLSLLLVDSAGGKELSFNCFFAFIASSFVISSFLINLFVIFAFVLDLILLSIYVCDIGFEIFFTLSNSEGLIFFFHL